MKPATQARRRVKARPKDLVNTVWLAGPENHEDPRDYCVGFPSWPNTNMDEMRRLATWLVKAADWVDQEREVLPTRPKRGKR